MKSTFCGRQCAGRVLAARFRLRLSVGLLRSSFTSCSLINKWWPAYFRSVRRVRGRNRFQTLHFKETVVPLFGEHDSCGKWITRRDHKHIMKCNATLGLPCAVDWNVSSCFSCLHTIGSVIFISSSHPTLSHFFLFKGVCAPSRAVKRCASLDRCWRASPCALDC